MIDRKEQIKLLAFAEPLTPGKSQMASLLVYVINESLETLEVLNDLDSINIPQDLPKDDEIISDANLIHIDFGVSGEGKFIQIAPGECLKIMLLLREEQQELLNRVKHLKTLVKFRESADQKKEEATVFLSSRVYPIKL